LLRRTEESRMTEPNEPPFPPRSGFSVPPEMYVAPEPLVSPDYAGWWSRGTGIIRAGWRPLLGVQLAAGLVSFVLAVPVEIVQLNLLRNRSIEPADALRATGLTLGLAAVAGFAGLLATLMTVHIVVQIASGRRAEFGPAARAALPRILPLLGWSLLSGVVLVAGLCACVIPFFFFLLVFTPLAPVVMFERGNAVSRCFRLFNGDRGVSAGRTATIVGLTIGVGLVASVVGVLVQQVTGSPVTAGGIGLITVLVNGILGVSLRAALGILTAPLTVLTYADQRARLDGTRSADLIRALGL
jgi:hypothetical protein